MPISDLERLFGGLSLNLEIEPVERVERMDPDQIKAIIEAAVSSALAIQKADFNRRLQAVTDQLQAARVQAPEARAYEAVTLDRTVQCDEALDAVKTLPEFNGAQEQYVSWRQAAKAAYKLYEGFVGSSKHYQAVLIIRNKIRGPADSLLASFNTVLNFEAIINRLDFTYSDKRPIHLLEQELATLRQGGLSINNFYEEVEKKLTLLTNKTIMSQDAAQAQYINEKYRADALRVFVSGLRRGLTDTLFAAQPADLPSALALAQEIEANHDRHDFATNYARALENKPQNRIKYKQGAQNEPDHYKRQSKNPFYTNNQGNHQTGGIRSQDKVEMMDVDPSSSKFRQPTAFQKQQGHNPGLPATANPNNGHQQGAYKRPAGSQRFSDQRRQRVDHLAQVDEQQYEQLASEAVAEIDEDNGAGYDSDTVNFLGENPCSRSSDEQ